MNVKVVKIDTDESLLRSLKEAAQRKPTSDEVREQRTSFVYGSMKSDSTITRDEVERLIKEQE